MPTCLTDNQIFHIFADNQHIGQVKISFGQPALTLHLPNGLVIQKANVEPCIFDVIRVGKCMVKTGLPERDFFFSKVL
jgi:hypothetical protein